MSFYIKIMFWLRWFYSLLERMRLKRIKNMFIHSNQTLITSFNIKEVPIFPELTMSKRWSAIFCATGVWGGKPIGRVRSKLIGHVRVKSSFSYLNRLITEVKNEYWLRERHRTAWASKCEECFTQTFFEKNIVVRIQNSRRLR